MKKIIAIMALVAITAAAHPQTAVLTDAPTPGPTDTPTRIVDWGIKAGANLSAFRAKNIPTVPDLGTSFGPGAEAGGFLDFNITHRFGIQFGLMGSYERCTVDFGDRTAPMQGLAIEVPIYALWRWGDAARGWLNVGVGPYTEFMLWGDIEGSNPYRHVVTDVATGDSTLATGDNLSGLALLLGYELPCGLQLNATYHYGISDMLLFEHDSRSTYLRPHKFTLGLGWRF